MKLLVIDAMNLIRRVYEANMREDSKEKAEGAIRASLQSFKRALDTHNPTHCVWCFDPPGRNTWRHTYYPGYKINRKPMPDVLRFEIDRLIEKLIATNWAVINDPHREADDTAGSISIIAVEHEMDVVLLSTDKDLVYLISRGISVFDHFAKIQRTEQWCLDKFGVTSEQMVDYLALIGDDSDGIPGVPKIGKVTAAKLLAEHKTLTQILSAAPSIKGVVGKNLVAHHDSAVLSKKLVQIDFDCMRGLHNPLEFTLGRQ